MFGPNRFSDHSLLQHLVTCYPYHDGKRSPYLFIRLTNPAAVNLNWSSVYRQHAGRVAKKSEFHVN